MELSKLFTPEVKPRNKFVPGDSVLRVLPVSIFAVKREWISHAEGYEYLYETSDGRTWREKELRLDE